MTHLLSLDEKLFQSISTGRSNFLLRRVDRNYQAGDKLIIQSEKDEETLNITDVIYEDPKGLMKNYCIISFKEADA